ncbi:hypothetical protein NL676_026742 [Syzygium grande]|nr:hypothetical protein NL676_026742 [Syzygium grande]
MNQLSRLQRLCLDRCDELERLPELPVSLKVLEFPPRLLRTAPNLSYLTSLVDLRAWDDTDRPLQYFLEAPKIEWIEELASLERLMLVADGKVPLFQLDKCRLREVNFDNVLGQQLDVGIYLTLLAITRNGRMLTVIVGTISTANSRKKESSDVLLQSNNFRVIWGSMEL